MLTPGSLVQNRYQIIRLLGQGGMGAVYQAQDLVWKRTVAIKENISGDPRQFQQEAHLLKNLSHPNLPRVLDNFDLTNAQYLVMDFVEGEDLDSILTRQGALPEAQALAGFDQILDAVAYLHSRGVIHRDIKPANIKITPQGQAVLVDFGIAKAFQSGQKTLTGAKAVTPGFTSPEQYRGGTDQRSDIYSLGATLYALMTGKTPPDALALASRSAMLMPPRMLNAALSMRTEQAILRAMAIAPDQRFQNVDEMRRVLVRTLVAPTLRASQFAPQTLSPTLRVRPRIALAITLSLVGVLIFLGLGGIIILWLLNSTSRVASLVSTATPTVESTSATATAPIAPVVFTLAPTASARTRSPTARSVLAIATIARSSASATLTRAPTSGPVAMAVVSPSCSGAPVISSFAASQSSITSGNSVSLSWSVSNATSVSIDNGVGSVNLSGNTAANPSSTTTYTLSASGCGGSTSQQVTITVSPVCLNPSISYFNASPTSITAGNSTTLSWSVSNANSASIDGGIGSVNFSGNTSANPASTTTYTLYANGCGGNASRQVSITVTPACPGPPSIAYFNVSPNSITAGNSTTLSWLVSNATSVSIDNGIGAVSASGSTPRSPGSTTTYTLSAGGCGGSASRQIIVAVQPSFPINSFVGTWRNVDAQTPDLSRLDISASSATLTMNVWSLCCGMVGTFSAAYTGNPFNAIWIESFATVNMTFTLEGATVHVRKFTHFTDNSGRADYTWDDYFQK